MNALATATGAAIRAGEPAGGVADGGWDPASFFVDGPAGLGLFDRECRYVHLNQTLADFAGRTIADHLGRRPPEVLPAPMGAAVEAGLVEVMASGAAHCNREIVGDFLDRSGGVRSWVHSQFPVRDREGSVVGAGVIVVETTAFRHLAAVSGQNAELFREIAENIRCVFWVSDAESGQILYLSPAYETIWGRSCFEVYLNPDAWMASVHPDDLAMVRASHLNRDRGEEPQEYRIIRRDGQTRWIRSRLFRVYNLAGRESRRVGIAEDITVHREVLDRLRDSEARYRLLFDKSIDGITLCEFVGNGRGLRFADCNGSFLRMTGCDKAELLGLADLEERMEKERGDSMCRPDGNGVCERSYSWRRADGRANSVQCRGSRVALGGREVMHCVHRDVTRVKIADEKIRTLSRRLMQSVEEEQRRIAGDLHDEFGQKLLVMRHQVDALREKATGAGWPEMPELARIDSLIDAVGASVRGAINRLRPDLLDTMGFVPALEWGVRDFAQRHSGMAATIEVAGSPRKVAPEVEIALYRVFQEGLTNIAKHAGAATVTVQLVFSYPCLILTISDDGAGFLMDQCTGLPQEEKGGLGLRGMRERMQAIGGRFSLRSRPGWGSVLRAEVVWLHESEQKGATFSWVEPCA